MNVILREMGLIGLFSFPIAVLLWTLMREKEKHEAVNVAPFDELLRRPAGESMRLKIQQLDEKLDPWLIILTAVPLLLGVVATIRPMPTAGLALFFLASDLTAGLARWKLQPLLQRRRRYRLGFNGERYVGAELNELMTNGFRVFHDVPFDEWNIDHVLVGPPGVFAIETKARRKPMKNDRKAYKVSFDGEHIHYPSGAETRALEQAERNARQLARFLSDSTGEKVSVNGIVTLPGWWITRECVSAKIEVLSPKQIRSFVLGRPGVLGPEKIQRIAFQLEQKSKLSLE